MIIDVRSLSEYQEDHIKGAVHMPLERLLKSGYKDLPADGSEPLYVHCRRGNRSSVATEFLKSAGYKNVYNIGSIDRAKELSDSQLGDAPKS